MNEPRRFGKYVLYEELGRGAMGSVWRASDPETSRIVALKILIADLAEPTILDRFLREAKIAARLDHPNIARLYEFGAERNAPFLAMQYVDGHDLAHGMLPVREAVRILRDVALAIDYAHQEGVVHRDLKPENILLARDGTAYVTDFGLAKLVDVQFQKSLTMPGTVIGTPAFMSPEQAAGKTKKVGPASDVYALGATLFGMLTGRPPFDEPTGVLTTRAVIEKKVPRLRSIDPKLPAPLESICLRAMAKEPEKRHPSARALAEECDRWLRGKSIETGRSTGRTTGRRRANQPHSRRFRTIQACVFLSPLLLLGAVVWFKFVAVEKPIVVEAPVDQAHGETPLPRPPGLEDPPPVDERPLPVPAPERGRPPTEEDRQRCEQAARTLEHGLRGLHSDRIDAALARKPFREVLSILDPVMARRIELPEAHRVRAQARSILLDPEGAIEDLSVAGGAQPDLEIRYLRGRECIRLHWHRLVAAGALWNPASLWPDRALLDRAAEDLEPVARAADSTFSRQASAYLAFCREDLAGCRDAVASIQAAGVPDADMLFLRALVQHLEALARIGLEPEERVRRLEAALAIYSQALDARWHFYECWMLLSRCQLDRGMIDQAIGNFEVGLSVYPKDPLVHAFLGEALGGAAERSEAAGRPDAATHRSAAAARLDRALELAPGHVPALLARARLRAGRDLAGATADAGRALEANPRSPQTLTLLALLRLAGGDVEGALHAASQSIELRSDGWEVYALRGQIHERRGDPRRAKTDYQKALKLFPPPDQAKRLGERVESIE